MASASSDGTPPELATAPMCEDSGASEKRNEPDSKDEKDLAQAVAETITACWSAYYEAEKNEIMKKEATFQAENRHLESKLPKKPERQHADAHVAIHYPGQY
eukprot:11066168-Karenia_brevis.AAC.1